MNDQSVFRGKTAAFSFSESISEDSISMKTRSNSVYGEINTSSSSSVESDLRRGRRRGSDVMSGKRRESSLASTSSSPGKLLNNVIIDVDKYAISARVIDVDNYIGGGHVITDVDEYILHGDPITIEDYEMKPPVDGRNKFILIDDPRILEDKKIKVPINHFGSTSGKKPRRRDFNGSPIGINHYYTHDSCSHPPPVPIPTCGICMEPKPQSDFFSLKGCSHMFCTDCISQYIRSKIQENVSAIRCPDPECKEGSLEPETCSKIIPADVFERWCTVLCQSLFVDSTVFYCPFKDCSGPLIVEGDNGSAIEVVRESECPHCRRLFCAQCKVPWHADLACEAFQKLGKHERNQEDIMLMNMAKEKNWQRCPKCKFFVEKIDGCMFLKCRCLHTFCYGCATEMTVNHFCTKCKR